MHENEITEHLELLDGLLNSDMVTEQAMSLSELDGFMAGMIVCPDPVLPGEWVPHVWGEKGIITDDDEEAAAINGVVIVRFKHLLFGLYQGFVHPVYDLNEDESFNWHGWAGGFARAMTIRPDAWEMFGSHDGGLGGVDAYEAVSTMKQLCAYSSLPEDQRESASDLDEKTLAMAPDLIAEAVLLLYGVKQECGIPISVSLTDTGPRVGRNDPCPCGSGQKYQDCCLPEDQKKRLEAAKRAKEGFA